MYLQDMKGVDFEDYIPERLIDNPPGDKPETMFLGHEGNFCVAVLKGKNGRLYAGVSKRNPSDNDNNYVGMQIAVVRAWRSMCGKVQGYGRQRPTPKSVSKFRAIVQWLNR